MDGSVLYSLVALADIGKACCPTSLAATSDFAFAVRQQRVRMDCACKIRRFLKVRLDIARMSRSRN